MPLGKILKLYFKCSRKKKSDSTTGDRLSSFRPVKIERLKRSNRADMDVKINVQKNFWTINYEKLNFKIQIENQNKKTGAATLFWSHQKRSYLCYVAPFNRARKSFRAADGPAIRRKIDFSIHR